MNPMKLVVTYQSPSGHQLKISEAAISLMAELGIWPRDSAGQVFCTVVKGKHVGWPDLDTTDINRLVTELH